MPSGSDVNTSLRCAALEGKETKVESLLQDGADVLSSNFQKNTALHMAVQYGHSKVVTLLLRHNAHPDCLNTNGQTPLQLACTNGYIDIVKQITKHGCDLHSQNDFSAMTALHYASQAGEAQICQHLLDVGADEEIQDTVDKIAEFYAANHPTELVFRKRKKNSKLPNKKSQANSQYTKPTPVIKQQQEPVQAPVKEPVKAPVKEPVKAPVKEPVKTPVKEPVKTPVKEPVKAPVPAPVAESPQRTLVKEPVRAPHEPQSIPIADPKGASATESVRTSDNKPAASEPSNPAVSQPLEESTDQSDYTSANQTTNLKENTTRNTAQIVEEEAQNIRQSQSTNDKQAIPITKQTSPSVKAIPETDDKSLASTSRDSRSWDRNPNKYGHTPGGGNANMVNRKLNWKGESSGYGTGVIKRKEVDKAPGNNEFQWSDAFKQRQQQGVFDRLMGGTKRNKQPEEGQGQAVKPRDRSPIKPVQHK